MKQIIIISISFLLISCHSGGNNNDSTTNEINPSGQYYLGIDQTDSTRTTITHNDYKTTGKVPHRVGHNGYSMSFESNKQIYDEGLELNGLKNGIWITYYSSGQIRSIIGYWDNQIDGVVKYFYKNGKMESEGYEFRKDRPKYKEEWEYDKDIRDSIGTIYLLNPDTYRHGNWNEYDSSGKLTKTTIYDMGKIIETTQY